jgi:hypothetical protein
MHNGHSVGQGLGHQFIIITLHGQTSFPSLPPPSLQSSFSLPPPPPLRHRNALVYGAKKWVLYPPSHMIMSNTQILKYFETDLLEFEKKGIHYATCVQTAGGSSPPPPPPPSPLLILVGDVLVVPESWGHGVLNIEDSVAVATESKGSMWRASTRLQALRHLPDDNRKKVGRGLQSEGGGHDEGEGGKEGRRKIQ